MKTIYTIFLLALTHLCMHACAQEKNKAPWNGKKCVVVLTYDDAIDVDLDNAIPALDSVGLKATFFVTPYFDGFRKRIPEWKAAFKRGHEIASHTMFHPCTGNTPDRSWVKPDYDMSKYSVQKMKDELIMTNVFLKEIDGRSKRTFAYPCGDRTINGAYYYDSVKTEFISARGVHPDMPLIDKVDLSNVPSYVVNGQSGEELIELVKQAKEKNGLLVFLLHGVGGGHSLNVELSEHRKLLRYLKQNQKDIWVTTFIEMSEYILKVRKGSGH